MRRRAALTLAAGAATAIAVPGIAFASGASNVYDGEIDGARFRVEVPGEWNGTLVLWNQPPIFTARPGEPVQVALDPFTRQWLLRNGYALAASNYRAQSSAAFEEAVGDQLRLLDWVEEHVGRPQRTIAWGNSGGGLLAALLAERYPERISGALPLCPVIGGLSGVLNLTLDYAFALTTLTGARIPLVGIGHPGIVRAQIEALLGELLETAQGRARLALASGLASMPGWAKALQPKPKDVRGQVQQQAIYGRLGMTTFWTSLRADLEHRMGGNVSGNVGVDYHRQIVRSSQYALVREAYWEAGLSLADDLGKLDDAPRISADEDAAWRLAGITPTGALSTPVLTVHPIGDGLAVPEHETAYADRVRHVGQSRELRKLYTFRGGHGSFAASEVIVAMQALLRRVEDGRWPRLDPGHLNDQARALGAEYQKASDWGASFQYLTAGPAFMVHTPGKSGRI